MNIFGRIYVCLSVWYSKLVNLTPILQQEHLESKGTASGSILCLLRLPYIYADRLSDRGQMYNL